MAFKLPTLDLTPAQFTRIARLVHDLCGIDLQAGKEGLVRTRLARRLHVLGLSGFTEYLELLESDASARELVVLVDAISTNKTSFFRESAHFEYLRHRVLPDLLATGRPLRFWSAGCSSGEEPYTLAFLLHEMAPDLHRRDVRILATDVSTSMVARARAGVYDAANVGEVPPAALRRFFSREPGPGEKYRVKQPVRSMVRFARLNLIASWPMRGPFDLIFCRNVMIYFDRPTQARLVHRFHRLLAPHGQLLVGHSESLSSLEHHFRYVQPAVYAK
jgi:chemotaxis protein methyltransferase CheR